MYKVKIGARSTKCGEVGQPVDRQPVVREHETAKAALVDIDRAIASGEGDGNCGETASYLIVMPDGRELPMVKVYIEVFGEEPMHDKYGEFKFPRLK